MPTAFSPYTPGGIGYNPNPQAGTGTFGLVPGPIPLPQPAAELATVYPNLTRTNQQVSDAIGAKLGGQLSPGTMKFYQDLAAQYSAGAGMPGSNAVPGSLAFNANARNLGLLRENIVQQGLQDYASLIPTISATQTVRPELQTQIAELNALNAAAPTPGMAQNYAQQLFDSYLRTLRGPGGGTAGTSSPAGGMGVSPLAGGAAGAGSPTQTATGAGYGEAWNDQGGYASVGIPDFTNLGFDPFDEFSDMPISTGFDAGIGMGLPGETWGEEGWYGI